MTYIIRYGEDDPWNWVADGSSCDKPGLEFDSVAAAMEFIRGTGAEWGFVLDAENNCVDSWRRTKTLP